MLMNRGKKSIQDNSMVRKRIDVSKEIDQEIGGEGRFYSL